MKHWQYNQWKFIKIDKSLIWKDDENFDEAMVNKEYESSASRCTGSSEGGDNDERQAS